MSKVKEVSEIARKQENKSSAVLESNEVLGESLEEWKRMKENEREEMKENNLLERDWRW